MKKIKVLMVGNSSTVKGGITSVISQILEHDWLSEGIDMKFIPTYVETNNVFKILYFAKAYRKIAHEIRVYKPDVVHIHMSYKGSFMRKYAIHKLCKKKGIRDIIHLHGSEFEKWYNESDDAKKMKIRCLLRECDSFIVLGDKWNHVIKGIEPKTKTVVVSNTVKIPEETIKRSFSCFQILFLGVLIKRKGVEDLLNAVKQLVDTRKLDNIKVVVAGTGAEEQNLKRQTKELNIESYIEFAGWTAGDKKKSLLCESQLLVLPSYNEGLPIAILEAISHGMPVISTNVGDISAAVSEGKNGYLIQPGDVSALADRMYRVISDRSLFEEFSAASRRKAIEEFSDENYFNILKECYQKG